jgi:methionyl aminopeptidase
VITLRSPREIDAIRRSGKITAKVLTDLMSAAKAGMTTADIDALAEKGIRDLGGEPTFKGYRGYPASVCTSVNDKVVHGIPGPYVLHEGDLLSIDLGTTLGGYVSDSAVTVGIGAISESAERLLRATQECLMLGIEQMRAGNHVGDIGYAVQRHAEANGYGVVRELVGHGVGTEMHEDPQVPNYGRPGGGPKLRTGLVLAVEPMITQGGYEVKILQDGWTVVTLDGKLAAHFEHTIALTEEGPKILTLRETGEHADALRYRPREEAAA